jgi:threonine dehydrogenase-like Zn-dependent dehydrogenase
MGLLALAGLADHAVSSLIAVDMLDERLEIARQLGATHCLNPKRDDVLAKVAEVTNGRGVDVAMEASTVPAGMELASRALRSNRPTLVVVTTPLGAATYDLMGFIRSGATVHFAEPAHSLDPLDDLRRAMDGIARGALPMEKLITHRFGLDEIGRGTEIAVSRTPGYIKGIVVPA